MSALHATRIAERNGATVAFPARPTRASGWARHGAGEPPAIALVKEHLNSAVVAARAAACRTGPRPARRRARARTCRLRLRRRFQVHDATAARPRRRRHGLGPHPASPRRSSGPASPASCCWRATCCGVAGLFPSRVILTWFVATPFALAAAHAAARKAAGSLMRAQRRGAARSSSARTGSAANSPRGSPKSPGMADLQDSSTTGALERLPRRMPAAPARPLRRPAGVRAPEHASTSSTSACRSRAIRASAALLDVLGDTTASIYFVPDLSAFDLMQARFGEIRGMPLVAVRETPFCGMTGVLKRASDIVLAAVALLLLAPLMAVIAILRSAAPRRDPCSSGSGAMASMAASSRSTSSAR